MNKVTLKLLGGIAAAGFSLMSAAPAHGATKAGATVALSLSDGDATPTARTVTPGTTFTITASLLGTEKVTGVDYFLQVASAGSGKFRIVDRNVGTSKFSDMVRPDIGDATFAGVEDTSVSLLGPRNGLDLGGSIANVNSPLAANVKYDLASYTISVAANTAPGTYVISTTSDANTGWVAPMPFDEYSFNTHGTFTVTVAALGATVPEPGTGLGLVGVAGLMMRRRR